MSQPQRQNVAQISAELGIPVVTLYNWRKALRLQGEVMPEYEKDPKGWVSTDKFKVVLPTAGLNTTELNAYCRKRGLYQQVGRWRQASKEVNEKQVLTLKEQKEHEELEAQGQKGLKRIKPEFRRKEQALAPTEVMVITSRKIKACWEGTGTLEVA